MTQYSMIGYDNTVRWVMTQYCMIGYDTLLYDWL
jgi:hypothetical protein